MARTYTSQKTFRCGKKEITIQKTEDGYHKVKCVQGGWSISKANLRARSAAWFILRCAQRKTKNELKKPQKRGKITNLLLDGEMYKMNGVEWIMTSMAHGTTPIILKAPQLFRQRLVYIEGTDREDVFSLRIIDPLTEHRTTPIEISRDIAEQTIKSLSHDNSIQNTQEREERMG